MRPVVMLLVGLQVLNNACKSHNNPPNWLQYTFVGLLVVSACALMVDSDALADRVPAQIALMRRALHDSIQWPFNEMPLWDNLQRSLECCGIHNATDWGSDVLPLSCCAETPAMFIGNMLLLGIQHGRDTSGACRRSGDVVHPIGCDEALVQYVRIATKWLMWCAFVFAFVAFMSAFILGGCAYARVGGGVTDVAAPSAQPMLQQQRATRPYGFESMA